MAVVLVEVVALFVTVVIKSTVNYVVKKLWSNHIPACRGGI